MRRLQRRVIAVWISFYVLSSAYFTFLSLLPSGSLDGWQNRPLHRAAYRIESLTLGLANQWLFAPDPDELYVHGSVCESDRTGALALQLEDCSGELAHSLCSSIPYASYSGPLVGQLDRARAWSSRDYRVFENIFRYRDNPDIWRAFLGHWAGPESEVYLLAHFIPLTHWPLGSCFTTRVDRALGGGPAE